MKTRNAYAVLSLREIRNLLAIAEREIALEAQTGELDCSNSENYCVVLRGKSRVREGKTQVNFETAGMRAGDRLIWSNEPAF